MANKHPKHPKTDMIFARVSPELKVEFLELADKLDLSTSDIVRELIKGFVDGSITLTPRRAIHHYPT